MLKALHHLNNSFQWRNMNPPTYRIDADLLRILMRRIGTGARITVRELAARTDLAVGTVGALLSGAQQTLAEDKAKRVAQTIGVDLLVLFVPNERAGSSVPEQDREPVAV